MVFSELVGRGWVIVEPPLPEDGESTVARFNGEPIKSGFLLDRIEDSDDTIHMKYRSGKYDLEVKVDFDIGRGQARVKRAEGYESE